MEIEQSKLQQPEQQNQEARDERVGKQRERERYFHLWGKYTFPATQGLMQVHARTSPGRSQKAEEAGRRESCTFCSYKRCLGRPQPWYGQPSVHIAESSSCSSTPPSPATQGWLRAGAAGPPRPVAARAAGTPPPRHTTPHPPGHSSLTRFKV